MLSFFKKNILSFVVFITGACVLVVEVVATRILSPYFGNTIFSVSSVLGVILGALSLGYYIGGRLADKKPSLKWFYGIILLSGLSLFILEIFILTILPIIGYYLSIISGPLLVSLILFFVPAFILGTLSPYAIKLQNILVPQEGIGSLSGKIFFWSTLGSIFGSLIAGFILIPTFGINQIIIGCGAVLFSLGFIPLIALGLNKKKIATAMIIFLMVGVSVFVLATQKNNYIYAADGLYERIKIYDGKQQSRPVRFFQQDRSGSGAMYLDNDDPTDLVYEYTKYYALYQIFKPELKNALVIGGGAYSIPKAILHDAPQATVDVSEIEPSLFNLAQKYFKLTGSQRLNNIIEDGRRYLHDTDKQYDFIYSDVYHSLYSLPAHFVTQEFFQIAKDRLSPDGVFIANIIGDLSREDNSFILSEIKTFRSVFGNSYFFAVDSAGNPSAQNIIFVGLNGAGKINFNDPKITQNNNPIIQKLGSHNIDLNRFELSAYPMLTDNYSPVDFFIAKTIQRISKKDQLINGQEILGRVDQQLRYGPRYLTALGHQQVQQFILAELRTSLSDVQTQSWTTIGSNNQKFDLVNIIGRYQPENEQRIILAAHYDSKKIADYDLKNPKLSVPGANDSASGVAVLLELEQLISRSVDAPKIGIDFVFFDGEEGDENLGSNSPSWQPYGSNYFAQNLDQFYKKNLPLAAVVLDMVGDKNLKIYKNSSLPPEAQSAMDHFFEIAKTINPEVFQDSAGQQILDDHDPLNRAGIPSFVLIDFDYPYWHTTADTTDKCSAQSLQKVAAAVLRYIYQFD